MAVVGGPDGDLPPVSAEACAHAQRHSTSPASLPALQGHRCCKSRASVPPAARTRHVVPRRADTQRLRPPPRPQVPQSPWWALGSLGRLPGTDAACSLHYRQLLGTQQPQI